MDQTRLSNPNQDVILLHTIKRTALVFLLCQLMSTVSFAVSGVPIGCRESHGSVFSAQLTSELVLNQRIIEKIAKDDPQFNRDELLKSAAELQLRHSIGYFRTTREGGQNRALGSFRGDIKIVKVIEDQSYGLDLKIDNYMQPKRDLNSAAPRYTQIVLEMGQLNKRDPALVVEYEVPILIADCSTKKVKDQFEVQLPRDPFLSLWVEDASKRKMRPWGPDQATISSCTSSEFVQWGSPLQSWFFWSPVEKKYLTQKDTVKCSPIKNTIVKAKVKNIQTVNPSGSLSKSFFDLNKPVQFYGIFGEISDHDFFLKADFKSIREQVQILTKACIQSKTVAACLTDWDKLLKPNEKGQYLEPGLYYFLVFHRDIHTLVKVEKYSVDEKISGNQILVRLTGKLRKSGASIVLNQMFTRTTLDYGPPASLEYSKFLNEALSQAHSISYLGHSGLGANLKFSNWENLWRRDNIKNPTRERPLWLGVYNCEGFSYFGPDLRDLYPKGKPELLMTLSTGVEAEAKFPLAQVTGIDLVLSGAEGIQVQKLMGDFVRSKDFYTEILLTDEDIFKSTL